MAGEQTFDERQSFKDLVPEDNSRREHNREITKKRRDFTMRIEEAVAKKVSVKSKGQQTERYRSKKEKLIALDKIVKEEGLENLDSTQLMQLFSSYRDLGASEKMIEVYARSNNKSFKSSVSVREQLADAYYKRSFAGGRPEELAKKDREKASKICSRLIDGEKAGAVAYNIAGKCLAQEGKKAERQKICEEGFKKTLDPFLGLQAMQFSLEKGDKERAKGIAKAVYFASLRDGAEESKDFYAVSAALQAACVAGESKDKIEHLSERLAHSVKYTWQLDEFNKNINAIRARGFDHETAVVKRAVNGWKLDKSAERAGLVVIKNLKKEERTFGNDEKLTALRAHSYSYRGCGSDFRGVSRVGGNMEFGGQLPSHTVSKKDLELFSVLLQYTPKELGIRNLKGLQPDLPLAQIEKPEEFIVAADRFVRQAFMTENFAGSGLHLEENALSKDGDGKSPYDWAVMGILEECGKVSDIKSLSKDEQKKEKRFTDTRTNISAILALGMGDCRHHAQAKQIMFDMYQRKQMNAALGALLDQTLEGKPAGNAVDNFYDALNVELRTTDVQVMMPIKMKQVKEVNGEWVPAKEGEKGAQDAIYQPELKDGKFTVDKTKTLHDLEDHTLCWLIKRDNNGNLKSLDMCDAFYQEKHYGWGNMPVDIEKGIVLEERKNGNISLKVAAGKISGDKTDSGEEIEVFQEPTCYNSGRREQEVYTSTGDDICLVGMQMKGFKTPENFLAMIKDRSGMSKILNRAASKIKTEKKQKKSMQAVLTEKTTEAKKVGEGQNISNVVAHLKQRSLG